MLHASAETEDDEDADDVTFTEQDIGSSADANVPQHFPQPPLPHGVPLMMGMPLQPGMPPRPMQFPGGEPHIMLHPPLPAPRSKDELVQDFKDLLLEAKVWPAVLQSPNQSLPSKAFFCLPIQFVTLQA